MRLPLKESLKRYDTLYCSSCATYNELLYLCRPIIDACKIQKSACLIRNTDITQYVGYDKCFQDNSTMV